MIEEDSGCRRPGRTNFDTTLTHELRAQARLAVKDEYAFDFLEPGELHSGRELNNDPPGPPLFKKTPGRISNPHQGGNKFN
jgi:hypothetical protein